jgi:ubiquinone/menaquinone biosynthesis C-methylase UbiE
LSARHRAREELAGSFADPDVAGAYQHRPPYPAEVFDVLAQLIADRPRDVLDLGAGEGALARPLAARVDHVDALDISAAMLAAGAARPGGRAPNLRWILGAAETAELGGPYALVTAGASLHWMAWETTLSRLARVMTDRAFLAIVDHGYHDVPWRSELIEVIARHSRSPGYDPASSVADELSARGLWQIAGSSASPPVPFRQPVALYVEQFHSTSSLARKWMPAEEAAAFDRAIEQVVEPYATAGLLDMAIAAYLSWGRLAP